MDKWNSEPEARLFWLCQPGVDFKERSLELTAAFSAALLMTASLLPDISQTSPHSESREFAADCQEVAKVTENYFAEHGLSTVEIYKDFKDIALSGRKSNPTSGKLLPWTDAQGHEVTDLKVYWSFVDQQTGEKLPFGIWHLRLSHYRPYGKIELAPGGGGCAMNVALGFAASGANVFAVLPLDSSWEYESNGRLERGYMDGVSTELQNRKAASILNERKP